MTTPINLNKHRKARARADRKAQADANAVKFGRSRDQKARETAADERARRLLDDHRREDG
ncbi:DUF4169 family protein [Actibacterium ureilyticum]|uniref:DUF4169 family protein n=1 Tax=Actibacterium ureilyticum TaxID=1590614 RepID=UPI000BAABEE9|nr:DUF4169 family protein [Actibacterium ureilyticum]